MGDKPFDRMQQNNLEKLLSRDLNRLQSYADQTGRVLSRLLLTPRFSDADDRRATAPSGFLSDSFKVRATDPLGNRVTLRKGIGYQLNDADRPSDISTTIPNTLGTNDVEGYKPLVLFDDIVINLAAVPAAPNSRIDIIEVKYARYPTDAQVRDILNPGLERFDPTNEVPKTLSWALDTLTGQVNDPNPSTANIGYKVGIPAAIPTAPTTTAGYVKIAEILVRNVVDNPAGTIDDDFIKDVRPLLGEFGLLNFSAKIAVPTGALAAPTVTHINAPPGVKLVSVATDVVGARHTVYIIAGNNNVDLAYDVDIELFKRLVDAPRMFWVSKRLTSTTITSGDQAAIQTGGNAAPAGIKVAVGQPCLKLELSALAWAGGAGNPSEAPADIGSTVTYRLSGTIGR